MKTKIFFAVFLTLALTSFVFAQTNDISSSTSSSGTIQSNISTGNNSKICPEIAAPQCSSGSKISTYIGDDGCQKVTCVPVVCPAVAAPQCSSGSKISTYIGDDGCQKVTCVPIISTNTSGGTSSGSSCQVGCVCSGDIMTCPTEQQTTITTNIQTGTSTSESATTSSISLSKTGSQTSIQSGNVVVVTSEDVSVIDEKLTIKTSSGNSKEIKILPEQAVSTSKIESVNNVELETSEEEAIYSISGSSSGKLLLVISVKAEITQKINAETGEIVSTEKPWWTFLASGI